MLKIGQNWSKLQIIPPNAQRRSGTPVPLSRFCTQISVLEEQNQIVFGNVIDIDLEKLTNLRKYDIYIDTGLVQILGHINAFLMLWTQLF